MTMNGAGPVVQWPPRAPARPSIPRRIGKLTRWALRAPADRLTIPAAAVVWGSGAILHAYDVPALDVGLIGGIALPAVTYGVALHRGHVHGQDNDHAAWRAAKASFGMLMAGAWAATAARWGVLAGPDHLSSLIYGAGAGIGYAFIRADELTRMKRNWRDERMRWLAVARLYGLQGSHLLASEATRLGKRLTVDVTGTGRRASVIASRDTAERIAEHRQLPPSRVHVTTARIAGRIHISIRDRDPWAHPIPHPLFDDAPEIEFPESQSITDPLVIGQDPESGNPITLTLYDEDGANGLFIIAITGSGKTVLLNDLMERLTACDNALVWDINLSKAKENRRWAPSCDLTAHGPREKRKALAILRMALKVIEYRGNSDSDDAVHVPTPEDPAIVVRVDEMDTLQGGQDPMSQAIRDVLNKINSKKRSEGVVLIEAGQRGVTTHAGSADIRANFNTFAIANVRSRGEMMHAAGDLGMDLPDMTTYGEGHPGVWLLATLGGGHQIGRTFKLKELSEISKIADGRTPKATLPVGLREYLGDAYERARTGEVTAQKAGTDSANPLRAYGQAILRGDIRADEQTRAVFAAAEGVEQNRESTFLEDLEKELTGDMDADLFEQWDKISEKNAATRRQLAELEAEDLIDLPPEYHDALRAAIAERTRQAAATVEIPAEHRQKIMAMLHEGAASADLMAQLGMSRQTTWRYLARLRFEGVAEMRGKGRGARWHAVEPGS